MDFAARLMLSTATRWTVVVLLLLLGGIKQSAAQTGPAVIHLRDGSTVRGTIVEQVPKESLTVRTFDNVVRVLTYDELDWISYAGRTALGDDEPPPGLESWYTYWGLGWSRLAYPNAQEPFIDRLRDDPDVASLSLTLDLLGVFVPLKNQKTVVGGIINAAAERFDDGFGSSVQYNQYLLSASAMHFVDQHIGRGFFVRGDVGLASVIVIEDDAIAEAENDGGVGILLGGGYALPVTGGTRLLFNANYARLSIGGENYGAFGLSIGGLF